MKISTCKYVQYLYPQGKSKLKKKQCDITTKQLEKLKIKIVPISNTGENVEKLYLSYFAGGNIK